jgi:hypothetical protein
MVGWVLMSDAVDGGRQGVAVPAVVPVKEAVYVPFVAVSVTVPNVPALAALEKLGVQDVRQTEV